MRTLVVVNAAEHVHRVREPYRFRNKSLLIDWLRLMLPNRPWSKRWTLEKIDSQLREEELILKY